MKKASICSMNLIKFLILIPLLPILLSGCTPIRANQVESPIGPLPPAYLRAVSDAANPEPDEVYDFLTPIGMCNNDLVRRTIDGQEYVLVVTWVGNTEYYKKTDQGGFYDTREHDIWVTVAHELRQRCTETDFGTENLDLRIKQLLGMPPNARKTDFVELWVRPEDLFRPCPDAQIDDRSCDLNLPNKVSSTHRAWFNDYRAKSYCRSDKCEALVPYPWTQLGYTYDWGNLESDIGLSEFVIKQNSKTMVHSIIPTLKYCQRE